ncbi:MAG: radical SAM protein [Fibrobacteres bacterium]|nr:radical SAM protein [Fibrobacterota bacterium]
MSLSLYSACTLCPRKCRVDRVNGKTGFCGETAHLRIGSIVAHFGEEPPISGTKGSGTVFFTGCSTGCFFCQNHQLSKKGHGDVFTDESFCAAVEALLATGVHNVNFVTPDHFWPHVSLLIDTLRRSGVRKPFIMNSSGFHDREQVADWAGKVDIFLPDFKYADSELSKLCTGRSDYCELALDAISEMVDLAGFLDVRLDGREGTASSGVLVRHLVLPGYIDNSLKVLNLLSERFGTMLPISVMSQYRPTAYCEGKGTFERALSQVEYDTVAEEVYRLGFSNVLFQPIVDEESGFTPDFNRKDPFLGNKKNLTEP